MLSDYDDWSYSSALVYEPLLLLPSPSTELVSSYEGLLACNKQTRNEMRAALARHRCAAPLYQERCKLDLMVNKFNVFATWLAFPSIAAESYTVEVDIRLFRHNGYVYDDDCLRISQSCLFSVLDTLLRRFLHNPRPHLKAIRGVYPERPYRCSLDMLKVNIMTVAEDPGSDSPLSDFWRYWSAEDHNKFLLVTIQKMVHTLQIQVNGTHVFTEQAKPAFDNDASRSVYVNRVKQQYWKCMILVPVGRPYQPFVGWL